MAGLLTMSKPAIEAELQATIRHWASSRFSRRTNNCMLSVLAYVEQLIGRVAKPSPRDLDQAEVDRLWRDEVAFISYAGEVFGELLHLPPTEAPKRGDVGVVLGMSDRAAIGICMAPASDGERPRWMMLGAKGVVLANADFVAAWSVSAREAA